MSKREIKIDWETIGPLQAERILNNLHPKQVGRHITRAINAYAKQMTDGEWRSDVVNPITIDTNGKLVNGYHRLQAVIKYGKPVKFLVAKNVDPESFGDYDAGVARSMAFRMGVSISRASVINSVARLCRWPNHTDKLDRHVSEKIQQYFANDLDYMEGHITTTARARLTQAGVRAALLLSIWQQPERKEELCHMYNLYVAGDFKEAPRSMLSLHRYLMKQRYPVIRVLLVAYDAFSKDKQDNDHLMIRREDYRAKAMKEGILKELVSQLEV